MTTPDIDALADTVRAGIYGDDRQSMTDCENAVQALNQILALLATVPTRTHRGIPLCPATNAQYVCSLKLHHVDDHEAWNRNRAVKIWKQEVPDA